MAQFTFKCEACGEIQERHHRSKKCSRPGCDGVLTRCEPPEIEEAPPAKEMLTPESVAKKFYSAFALTPWDDVPIARRKDMTNAMRQVMEFLKNVPADQLELKKSPKQLQFEREMADIFARYDIHKNTLTSPALLAEHVGNSLQEYADVVTRRDEALNV